MKKEHPIALKSISIFLAVVGLLVFFQFFLNGAVSIFPKYVEASSCNTPSSGAYLYPAPYSLTYSVPGDNYSGWNDPGGSWSSYIPDGTYTQSLGAGYYSGSGPNCGWSFTVTNTPQYPCSVTNGTFTYPYTMPASSIPPGTYTIHARDYAYVATYGYPGYSQGATALEPGYYSGSGPGCSWNINVVYPPPALTWYGTTPQEGGTVARGEDYVVDLRANQAIMLINVTNTWGNGVSHYVTYSSLQDINYGLGNFDCGSNVVGGCFPKIKWDNPARYWGGGGLDGTYFINAPAGYWDMGMSVMGVNEAWSTFHYSFLIAPPPTYTHYTAGSWSDCTGYNLYTGEGGSQTRTVSSYTNGTAPNESAPPSSQGCSVSAYTHYTVGSWSACSGYDTQTGQGGTQTRTVSSSTNTIAPSDSLPSSSQSCSVPTYTHYNTSAWSACAGYSASTGQGGTQTQTVTSYTNTTGPSDSQPASSQSCNMPPDFNFLSVPGSGALGNTYSTFVTFTGGQQSALSAPVSIAVSPVFPNYPSPPSLSFSVTSSPLPSGVSYIFTPNPLSSAQYSQGTSFVINVPRVNPGVYTLTVEASGGGIVKQATVYLNVNEVNPSFIEI